MEKTQLNNFYELYSIKIQSIPWAFYPSRHELTITRMPQSNIIDVLKGKTNTHWVNETGGLFRMNEIE